MFYRLNGVRNFGIILVRRNHYQILGIQPDASKIQIQKAYKEKRE